ncbi:hypothetical protein OIU78_022545 [Salix suchowensis]|nr:hypothetical protein OIU78_022545 [Salix suchowensis]
MCGLGNSLCNSVIGTAEGWKQATPYSTRVRSAILSPSNAILKKVNSVKCHARAAMPKHLDILRIYSRDLICCEEYRIRTSSSIPPADFQELFQIEHGVCTICRLDCHQLVRTIKPLSLERRREYIEEAAPNVASQKKLLDKLANNPCEGNAWHADHIVPVYRGGGECKVENMRTLCVACHSKVTAAQRAERCSTREKARKQLEVIMNDMKYMEETATNVKGQGHSRMREEDLVDELLVKVPGSAYSGGLSADPESEELKKSSNEEG